MRVPTTAHKSEQVITIIFIPNHHSPPTIATICYTPITTSRRRPTSTILQTMVTSGTRKPNKAAGSRKTRCNVSTQIRKNIPFDKRAVVTRTQVACKVKNRVVTKSTKVVVPVTPSAPPEPDPLLHVDIGNTQTPDKPKRKGPSRSVAVCCPFSLHS